MANIKKIWFDGDVLDLDNIGDYATDQDITDAISNYDGHVRQYYYTKTQVDGLINTAKAETLNAIYPVGAIYMSVNSASPSTLFGGTWERIQDTFLLASGSSWTAGATGGEASHLLTASESGLPSHNHRVTNQTYTLTTNSENKVLRANAQSGTSLPNVLCLDGDEGVIRAGNVTSTETGDAAQAHNNMPPYLAVYVWKRTA